MKSILHLIKITSISVSLILLALQSSAQGQNLLTNGSFESSTSGWTPLFVAPLSLASIDNAEFFDGSASARIEIISPDTSVIGAFVQAIPIQAGHRYLMQYAVKTQAQSALVFPFVFFNNAVDSQIYSESVFPSFGITSWKTHSYRFIAPPGSVTFTVMLVAIADSGSNSTTAWFDAVSLTEETNTALRDYQIDLSADVGSIEPDLSTNVGPVWSGNPNDLTPDFRRLGIRFVRTHDYHTACDISIVFPDTSADPFNPASYAFASTDTALSAVINSGAEVFFRLGEGYGQADTNLPLNAPPTDFAKWAQVALQVVKHYNEGWNNGFYYNIRYWEIWNEPDLTGFWTGSAAEYAHLYAITSQLLKAHDPTLQIGGPAIASVANGEFLRHFFDTLAATGAPLDFFSYHNYVASNPMVFCEIDAQVNAILDSYGYGSIPTFITEWNNYSFDSNSWSEWGRDDALSAAMTASSLIYMQQAGITGAMRYRTDEYLFGLFRYTGDETHAGLAFEAFSALRQTPNGIATSGADSLGTALIAGHNDYATKITAIVSDNSSNANGYRLRIKGLGQTPKLRSLSRKADAVFVYHYEILRIDSTHQLTLSDSGSVYSDNPVISISAHSPFVDKLTFQLIDTLFAKGSSATPTIEMQVYPNPFNSVASITFETSTDTDVRLEVYNILGQRVATLIDETMNPGPHRIAWEAGAFASGFYFVRITTAERTETRRIVLLK